MTTAAAKSPGPIALVQVHTDAVCYDVRNGFAWANIFVRHGHVGGPSPRTWAHVSVISDYGSFGYCWTHISEDWRAFLAGLDMHYAMQKMMGERFRVPLDGREAQIAGQGRVLDLRRVQQAISKAEARTLYDAAEAADIDSGCGVFLRDWDARSEGLFYAHELWDGRWNKVNPQAEGFWADVWPHFAEALLAGA